MQRSDRDAISSTNFAQQLPPTCVMLRTEIVLVLNY
jgi:hypothetical protein